MFTSRFTEAVVRNSYGFLMAVAIFQVKVEHYHLYFLPT